MKKSFTGLVMIDCNNEEELQKICTAIETLCPHIEFDQASEFIENTCQEETTKESSGSSESSP